MQNGSSVGICTRCTHAFRTFCTDLYAHSVRINKISASEVSWKFIKSALLVGRTHLTQNCTWVTHFALLLSIQLKYKRRVYKMLQLDEKQLKSANSKASLKKFLDHVGSNSVEKVNKMCAKGLDPNFHCPDTGGEIQ